MNQLQSRAVLRLGSPEGSGEVRDFLQGLVTNDTGLLRSHEPLWAALLSAQGKVLFDFLLWADGDDVLVDCEGSQADALARRLSLYRLRRPVTIARDAALGVFWSPLPDQPRSSSTGLQAFRPVLDPRLPQLGERWIGGAEQGAEGSDAAWLAHRLSLGVTEGVAELGSDQTLWLECNAVELAGVSFTKGCYVGQENTARMNWRQKINRRLVVVPTDRADAKRVRIVYPQLGLAVEHRRVEDLAGLTLPEWLDVSVT